MFCHCLLFLADGSPGKAASAAGSADTSGGSAGVFTKLSSKMKGLFFGKDEPEPEFVISKPTDFRHLNHVKADDRSSTGFTVCKIPLCLPLFYGFHSTLW